MAPEAQQLRWRRPRRRGRAEAATVAAAAAASLGLIGWLIGSMAVNFGGWEGLPGAIDATICSDRCFDSSAGLRKSDSSSTGSGTGRQLLWLPQFHLPPSNACTPRSIETFPPDLFSLTERRRGAVLLHAAVAFWLLAALAIVCDDYFVSALEVLCDFLHLKPDVAGATFMAAGSSAPELFASAIGVFFTKSDVGISTIVGSALFNLLCVVSLCGLFATQAIYLSWWPMLRDCGYYSLSIVCLVLVLYNEEVHWYESSVFLVLYALYIVIMYFNERIDQWISVRWPHVATGGSRRQQEAAKSGSRQRTLVLATENGTFAYTQLRNITDKDEDPPDEDSEALQLPEVLTAGRPVVGSPRSEFAEQAPMTEVDLQQPPGGPGVDGSSYESPLSLPKGWLRCTYWFLTLPWTLAFVLTVPDCRRPGRWRRVFFITLLNSILWIGGLSYLLVWMVCAVGDTLGIPDTVMGLTLLAAGTSVPDALASVFVVRDGFGDMAISNSVGSNVFDILVCLGLPWFLSTAVRTPGSVITISSAGLAYSATVLLSTVLLLFLAVYANRMRLDRRLGAACMLLYLLFIAVSVLFETNVFANLNPPPCPRERN